MFPFTEVVLIDRRRRTLTGKLVLGGRTKAGDALNRLGGFVAQIPMGKSALGIARGVNDVVAYAGGQDFNQEILGTDGPSDAVVASGGVAKVQLSEPDREQTGYGSFDLHGPAGLVLTGLPRATTVLLSLERLS